MDRLYMWLYRRSIRKYDKKTYKNTYYAVLVAIRSKKYSGVALHKLHLQSKVLRERIATLYGE